MENTNTTIDERKWVDVADKPLNELPGLFEGPSFECIRFGNHVYLRGREQ